jgi:hypothetical protein
MSAAAASENMVAEGSSLAVSGRISVGEILAVMKAASDGEMADLMGEMFRGNLIFQERCRAAGTLEVVEKEVSEEVVATPVKAKAEKAAKAPAAPKKAPKEKKVAVAAAEGEEPTAASYRLEASEIKADRCQARKTEGGEDRNWKPIVYRESQCPKAPVEGEELCKGCALLFEKESQDDKFKKWHGLVTEDLLDHTHILGSDWATKKCKWVPTVATGTAVSAPESAASEEGESAPSPPPSPALAAAAAAAAPAAKAPKAPKKEAKAPAAKKEAPAKKEEAKPAAAAAAAAVSEPVAEAGEIMPIAGEFYWVVRGNVYEYDQIEEKPGDFVGRLRADESIDADGEEETA